MLKDVTRFRALAVGPGLGRDDRAQAACRRLIAEAPFPIVVDADALNALADRSRRRCESGTRLGSRAAVLTPHAGEYERLAGRPVGADRVAAARDLAARTERVVVLKGPGTVIAAPGRRRGRQPHRYRRRSRPQEPATCSPASSGRCSRTGVDAIRRRRSTGATCTDVPHAAGTGPDLVAIDLIGALHPTLDALRSGRDPWED